METLVKNKPSENLVNGFSNKGFALVYSENLYQKKIVDKKITERSLTIFQKNLKILKPFEYKNLFLTISSSFING